MELETKKCGVAKKNQIWYKNENEIAKIEAPIMKFKKSNICVIPEVNFSYNV